MNNCLEKFPSGATYAPDNQRIGGQCPPYLFLIKPPQKPDPDHTLISEKK
jgi:hypothetical protein